MSLKQKRQGMKPLKILLILVSFVLRYLIHTKLSKLRLDLLLCLNVWPVNNKV